MKICPQCGAELDELMDGYMCPECGEGIFSEDEVITPLCPYCGNELEELNGEFFCYPCNGSISDEDVDYEGDITFNDDDSQDFEQPDYDSMIDNGDKICLNCTYWSVSPYGAAHGMICRRGYPTDGPGDSCSDFVKSYHFANYGDDGQYQFDETRQNTANKLYYWKNKR